MIINMDYLEMQKRQEEMARKKFLWIAVLVWTVLTLLGGCFFLRPGIYVQDDFLYRTSPGCYRSWWNEIRSCQERDAIKFEAVWHGQQTTALLVWHGEDSNGRGQRVSVSFQNEIVVEGIWNGAGLLEEDGFFKQEVTIIVNQQLPPPTEIEWSRIFCRIASEKEETRGHAAFLVFGTVAYVMGALGFLFPDKMHFFMRRWQYEQPELSDMGRAAEKTGSILVMIIGGIVLSQIFLLWI